MTNPDMRAVNNDLLQQALDIPAKDTYTYSDVLDAASAEVVVENFESWVRKRLVEEGVAGTEFEVVDGSRPAGTMVKVEEPTAWERWNMLPLTRPSGIAGLMGQGTSQASPVPHVRMQKYTSNDRGPGSHGPVVAFPLDLLLGERAREERYQQYLALKAEFEGGVS